MKALRHLLLIVILLLRGGTPVLAESAVVSVTVEPGSAGGDTALTFAHAFQQGDISESLAVRSGNQNLPAQVDVKRRYADGSVKHAIITTTISGMSPGVAMQLDLYTERASARQASKFVLPEGFEAEVVLTFPDGSERRAYAREFLTKAQAGEQGFTIAPWLSGPLASEIQLIGSPVGKDGDRDPDLLVVFGLRVLSGGRAVRTEVVVESPWIDVPGNVPYDVRLAVGEGHHEAVERAREDLAVHLGDQPRQRVDALGADAELQQRDFALEVGAPGAYDYGPDCSSWLTHQLTLGSAEATQANESAGPSSEFVRYTSWIRHTVLAHRVRKRLAISLRRMLNR